MSSYDIKPTVVNAEILFGDIHSINIDNVNLLDTALTLNSHEVAPEEDAIVLFGDEPEITTLSVAQWLKHLYGRTIKNRVHGSVTNDKKITELEAEIEKVQDFNITFTWKPYKDLTEEEAWKLGYSKTDWESERSVTIREFYEEVNKWNQYNRLSCVLNQNKSTEIEGIISQLTSRIEYLESYVEQLNQRISNLENE